MVRLVKILGIFFLLGFFLWALLPGYNQLVEIMNSTSNMTELETAGAPMMLLVIIPAVIVIAVIWHYFAHKGDSGGGGEE